MGFILDNAMLGVVLLPLLASILVGLLPKRLPIALTHYITIGAMVFSLVLSLLIAKAFLWDGLPAQHTLVYTWGTSGSFQFHLGFLQDALSALMLLVVTFISLLVHIYSVGYMAGESGYTRFFCYISFFTFAMLLLVSADNFLQLFLGWEGVGLASYLLIGFWFKKDSANAGSLKAFLVNRVGDFGFLLGMAAILNYFGTLNYEPIFFAAPLLQNTTIAITTHIHWSVETMICLLLFIGAMGKSAQMPLHVWLPDSMEGPTPISALIHAATMVTAGVYMVSRLSPLFEYSATALSVVLLVGATTALFTGILALVQNDIKRVIAYSTLSQLGYMVAALGASAYTASLFHLATHACFKALLFLAAGSVIMALHHEQNIQKMGNLRRYLPITYATFLVGSLALIAIPPFSGFYSKTAIIEWVHESHQVGAHYAYLCLVFAAFFTALYTFRLFFLVFHTQARTDVSHQPSIKEPHWTLWLPPLLLTIPAMVLGYVLDGPLMMKNVLGDSIKVLPAHLLQQPPLNAIQQMFDVWHHPAMWFTLAGIGVAWLSVIKYPHVRQIFIDRCAWFYRLLVNQYGFDRFNQWVFVEGAKRLADVLFNVADVRWLDGVLVNGTGRLITQFSTQLKRLQSGYLYHYLFAMVLGVLFFLLLEIFYV